MRRNGFKGVDGIEMKQWEWEIVRKKNGARKEQVVSTGFSYKLHADAEAGRMNDSITFPEHEETMPVYVVREVESSR